MSDLYDYVMFKQQQDKDVQRMSGENLGMISAFRGQGRGGQSAPGSSTPIPADVAQQAAGTTVNPATGSPIDLETAQRVYATNKAINNSANADTEQKLSALAQDGSIHSIIGSLPDDAQGLLEKFTKNGGGNLNDTVKLNGYLNAAMRTRSDLRKQQMDAASLQGQDLSNQGANIANQQRAGELQLQNQQIPQQMAAMRRMQGLSQYMSGAGRGVMSPDAQANAQQSLNDPLTSFSAQYYQNFGSAPPKEVIEKFLTQRGAVEQPVGLVKAGLKTDPKLGTPTTDVYNRVYRNGLGATRIDNSPIEVPFQSQAPGQVLDPSSFSPTGSNGAPVISNKPIVMTEERQKQLADAHSNLMAAQMAADKVNQVVQANQTLTQSGLDGSRLSGIFGGSAGQRVAQLATGNTAGQSFDGAVSSMAPVLMNAAKGTMRNQKEFELFTNQLPSAKDAPAVRQSKINNIAPLANFMVQRSAAIKNNISSGMSQGDAEEKAAKDVPFTSIHDQAQGQSLSPRDQQAMEWAKANPKDPRASAILKKLGQ